MKSYIYEGDETSFKCVVVRVYKNKFSIVLFCRTHKRDMYHYIKDKEGKEPLFQL
jgi:hypothetical protein